ncbi:hypothetical protein [Vibrio fluvialis]|uniref:hypothetical protein n=1 Tax=Vibrio fluvialis TaxID=676 RepID=UPI001EECECF1|nr:hypothetical protein [Vibrio fluvialis]MCG6369580.1 hypothetical protein [Vibrio fluvialis]
MKKFVIPCLGLILLAGCDQAQQSAAEGNSTQNAAPQVTDNATSAMCSNEKLAGGWHDADVSPEAEQAVDAVLAQMGNGVLAADGQQRAAEIDSCGENAGGQRHQLCY